MKYLVAIFLILTYASCNPAKRLGDQQKQYQQLVDEYIKNHPQRIDTATKFLPGIDSSNFYKHIADSLQGIKSIKVVDVQTKYKDTCTTAVDTYNEGFDFGYRLGIASCTQKIRVDTVVRTIEPTGQLELLQRQNVQLTAELAAAKIKDASEFNWLWPFIISVLINIFLTALLIKKF